MCAVDVCKCVQLILEQIEIDQKMTVFYKKTGGRKRGF
ncbi:hypothetical protein HPSSW114_0426 [Glaesserella parasuis SW114]|nr:hypothetical protein HPSMNH_0388 [Glaesserella parasuis MN-H]EQA03531.1 hypothetical protein HPSSW114_0426 [Glaesserella parasuis SW114]